MRLRKLEGYEGDQPELDRLSYDGNLLVVLVGTRHKVSLTFYLVTAFRLTDEGLRTELVAKIVDAGVNLLYQVEDGSLMRWVVDEAEGVFSAALRSEFLVVTPNEIIEIVADTPPEVVVELL